MDILEQIEYLKNFISERRFERFLSVLNYRTRHLTIVLEDVFQGHNASAVIRSCECFGIQDVYFVENRNEFKTNEEVSMGSAQWVSIYRFKEKNVNNTERCMQVLREKGYRIVATSPYAPFRHQYAIPISAVSIEKPISLWFGAEKEGLSEYALQHADEWVYIPMYGFTESFNISVSAALCMYELMSKLRHAHIQYHLSEHERNDILLQWLKNSIKDADKILAQKQNE